MDLRRRFASAAAIPGSGLVVIGGESDSRTRHSSVEILTDLKWTPLSNLPDTISRHCSVVLNHQEVVIIGGFIGDDPFSGKALIFNPESGKSYPFSSGLKTGRQLHDCALINRNKIVVVGGRSLTGFLRSIEVLNTVTGRWDELKHLELPMGGSFGRLLPAPSGDFIMTNSIVWF